MCQFKDKLIDKIRTNLYTLSEDRYTSCYSTQKIDTSEQVSVIKALDELHIECFGTSYLKNIDEYIGYSGWIINTQTFCYDY